jgi:hypothetical protein
MIADFPTDHAADPVVSVDAECVEVGHCCRMWPERCDLGGGPVRAMLVVMRLVLAQDVS